MAMALGVTASAYAANPFSDVPAGHWAYDSVSKLAAAGVIEGYGDTTFGGDKLMTRYEMAQIVAKAMAKGANVDKLAAEFADELQNLGVRVAKLEKKADNVKITGRFRFQQWAYHGNPRKGSHSRTRWRSDITLKGAINDDWTYTAMLRNEQFLDKGNKNSGEERTNFQRAYVSGRIGGLKVTAGRYSEYLADGLIYDWVADGVVASYGNKKLNITAGYLSPSIDDDTVDADEKHKAGKIAYAVANGQLGKVGDLTVGYYNINDKSSWTAFYDCAERDVNILSAKLGLNLGKNLKASYTYLHASEDDNSGSSDGHVMALNYKGANKSKPGSYGLEVVHYDQAGTTYINGYHTMDGWMSYNREGRDPGQIAAGFKGWKVGGSYVPAKNIMFNLAWYDLKSQDGRATLEGRGPGHTGSLFADLNFYF